ncbi:MAG TPA: RIP metalloprotease RseP, partial [Spirochaetia bacterium]|nr:RIP metalloprotease RseP [Spirochaetia bacterium]
MILLTLLFGLIGLGIIVFIHESGHFIAAKSCGIEVETFSLGWGRKMVGFEYGGTTYQISWFPIGGFCKMKGEMLKGDMSEEDMEKMRHERGSFLAASPWQRAVVGVAGPLANILFAVLVLTLIWWIGFNVHSSDNRIILASDHTMDPFAGGLPAEKAGLETGDRIVGIDGEKIDNFWQISESVKRNPGRPLIFQIKRESGISKSVESLTVSIVPDPDPESGQGRIGIYAWIPPVVSKVETAKPGDLAGLKPGDLITRMNDREIRHDVDFFQVLWEKPQNVLLTFKRGQQIKTGILHLEYDKNGSLDLGLVFE